jgi:ABC-type nitrate/sulfonate/bicarbonate transport system substrate-binding protein
MITLSMAGCGQKAPLPPEKIVLGTQAIIHSAPVWIAEKKGYFQEEGLQWPLRNLLPDGLPCKPC